MKNRYKWTNVNTSLPDKGLRVLVKVKDHVYVASFMGSYESITGVYHQFLCDYPEKIQFCYPEYWMRLPV